VNINIDRQLENLKENKTEIIEIKYKESKYEITKQKMTFGTPDYIIEKYNKFCSNCKKPFENKICKCNYKIKKFINDKGKPYYKTEEELSNAFKEYKVYKYLKVQREISKFENITKNIENELWVLL